MSAPAPTTLLTVRLPTRRMVLVIGRGLRAAWWWAIVRLRWTRVCRQAHLADPKVPARIQLVDGQRRSHVLLGRERQRWVTPTLKHVRIRGHSIVLTIRARPGQTMTELEEGAERVAATFDAHTFRTWPHLKHPGSTLVLELGMRDVLTTSTTASEPAPRAQVDVVRLGRTQAGADWLIRIRGRHTLCVGASGAGKGSVLWGIACGLAYSAHTGLVRLWGIDLKRGVELAIGAGLYSTLAYTPEKAVEVLRDLVTVIEARGAQMVGKTRLHQPTAGDPLHVLIIDELAALTAYAPLEIRREADKLLGVILTQGRALGVVVVAFVQDPRKEVVGMRSLFTQTVALRLRSSDETAMVLGDGMHRLAPAHRINPSRPGTGWIVEDTGAVDRVRADYWPDDLIRALAARYRPGPAGVTDADVASNPTSPSTPQLQLVEGERS